MKPSDKQGEIINRVAKKAGDYDTINPEEVKQFIADGGARKCRLPAEKAARIAAEIILEASAEAT